MPTNEQVHILESYSDDIYGLWELDWEFNVSNPEYSSNRRIEILKPLIEKGYIELYHRRNIREQTLPIDPKVAVNIISDYKNWEAPAVEGESAYYITSSTEGEKVAKQGRK